MTQSKLKDAPTKSLGWTLRALEVVERVGNKLPHPFWLFVILAGVVILISGLLQLLGVSAVSPANGQTVAVRSLMSYDGVRMMVDGAIDNFVKFPPLGVVLVVMLGVSVADKAGLLTAILRSMLARVPVPLVTLAIAFAGSVSHIASDAGFVIMIPLGAIAYRSIGRSPLLGAVVAYVAVAAGHNSSPIITATDALLSGLTTAAAQTIDPNYVVTPVDTYYFSLASSVLLSITLAVVVETVLKRRVAAMEAESPEAVDAEDLPDLALSQTERRGLRRSGLLAVAFAAGIALALLPENSPLRGEHGELVPSVFIENIAVFLGLLFFLTGIVYGCTVGTIKSPRDIPELMSQGVKELAPILVLFFAVSQFLAYFKWTSIGEVIAILSADGIKNSGANNITIFLGFILVVSILNLLITSGSAMWSLIAPTLVPMLMLLDISPETSWALYRIADSVTNCITPMSPYFMFALIFIRRYRADAGVGTLISLTLPVALAFMVVWVLMFLAWYSLGIPLGPGTPVR